MKNKHGVDVSAIRVGDYITHDDNHLVTPGRQQVLVVDGRGLDGAPFKVASYSGSTQACMAEDGHAVLDPTDNTTLTMWVEADCILSHEPAPAAAPAPDPMAQMLDEADRWSNFLVAVGVSAPPSGPTTSPLYTDTKAAEDARIDHAADVMSREHDAPTPGAPDLAAHAADANRQMAQMLADERARADRIESECRRLRADVAALRQRPTAPDCVLDHLVSAAAMLDDAQPGTPRAGIRDRVLAIAADIEAAVDLAALATPGSGSEVSHG